MTTVVMTATQPAEDAHRVIDALGPNWPGERIVIASGVDPGELPDGWRAIVTNRNYGIGSVLNLATRISREWLLLLEDDWILYEAPDPDGMWLRDAIALCERNSLDMLKLRRHRSPRDVQYYRADDWVYSDALEDSPIAGQQARLRRPGPWLMQNSPHLRRTSTFADMAPFVEHDGVRYRDAWYTDPSVPKEEVAISEFNARAAAQQLRVGFLFPGLFVHELWRDHPAGELACDPCPLGFLSGIDERGVSWCTRCTKKPEDVYHIDNQYWRAQHALDRQR